MNGVACKKGWVGPLALGSVFGAFLGRCPRLVLRGPLALLFHGKERDGRGFRFELVYHGGDGAGEADQAFFLGEERGMLLADLQVEALEKTGMRQEFEGFVVQLALQDVGDAIEGA